MSNYFPGKVAGDFFLCPIAIIALPGVNKICQERFIAKGFGLSGLYFLP